MKTGTFLLLITLINFGATTALLNLDLNLNNILVGLKNQLVGYTNDVNISFLPQIQLFSRMANLSFAVLLNETDNTPIADDVTFFCINRKSGANNFVQTYLNDSSINQKLNLTLPVTFIVHGWIQSRNSTWVPLMASELLKFNDINVCVVDWSRLANYFYTIAVTPNVYNVANYLSLFLQFINSVDVSFDNVTLIGHSLGGQIIGIAGNTLNGTIGQIFALDPASPLFCVPLIDASKRLNPNSAKYVQAIYTTRFLMGCGVDIAMQNFKPNLGFAPQKGCIIPNLLNYDGPSPDPIVCSHMISTKYFIASIDPSNKFLAKQSVNDLTYLAQNFINNNDKMGIYANREAGNFYLFMTAKTPYVWNGNILDLL